MSAKISLASSAAMALIAGIFCATSANAQGASSSSLADQLKAQYKLAKIVPESNSYKVAEPGTLLVIQKDGIFGVPLGNNSVDPVIYAIHKDADLHHSTAGTNAWKFAVGHKVYLSKVDVDSKHEKVLFTIVECDPSNPAKPSYYKSIVDFEFPNGYLAAAEVGQIEDVIRQVLTIDNGSTDPQPAHGGQSSSGLLTNDDIIKLAQAKLSDSILIAKIKSSTCDFDTSPDGLIKLKRAEVSDSVLQAIVDAQPAPKGEVVTPDVAPPAPGALSFSVRHRHSLWETGDSLTHYCSGTLSVSSNGTVTYDCAQTDDPSGRCEHVSLPPGSLKQVKIGSAGNLHLTSTTHLNYDFNGNPDDIKQAQAAISRLIQPSQK